MKKNGFTLLEVVFAMAVLAIAALLIFTFNRSSNQQAMDSYYEFLAFSLAREPIEVFRGFGYDNLKLIVDGNHSPPAEYQINRMQDLNSSPFSPIQHPAEASMFKRLIELKALTHGGLSAIKIKVTVAAKSSSHIDLWMKKRQISLTSLIVERPK